MCVCVREKEREREGMYLCLYRVCVCDWSSVYSACEFVAERMRVEFEVSVTVIHAVHVCSGLWHFSLIGVDD